VADALPCRHLRRLCGGIAAAGLGGGTTYKPAGFLDAVEVGHNPMRTQAEFSAQAPGLRGMSKLSATQRARLPASARAYLR